MFFFNNSFWIILVSEVDKVSEIVISYCSNSSHGRLNPFELQLSLLSSLSLDQLRGHPAKSTHLKAQFYETAKLAADTSLY